MYGECMEEITTRFEIIRLAVKMADHETVSIQAEKLREFRPDEDLDEIIALLENKNYRQALFSVILSISSRLIVLFFCGCIISKRPSKRRKKMKPASISARTKS